MSVDALRRAFLAGFKSGCSLMGPTAAEAFEIWHRKELDAFDDHEPEPPPMTIEEAIEHERWNPTQPRGGS